MTTLSYEIVFAKKIDDEYTIAFNQKVNIKDMQMSFLGNRKNLALLKVSRQFVM